MCESKERIGLFQINTEKNKLALNEDVARSSDNVPVGLSEIDDEKNISEPRKKSAKNVKKSTPSKWKSKTKRCRNDRFRVVSKPRSRSLSVESLKSVSPERFYFANNKLCAVVNDVAGYYSSVDELSEDMKRQKKRMTLRRDLLKHLTRSFSKNRSFESDQETHIQKYKLTRAKSCDPRYRKGHLDNHYLLRVSPSVDLIQPFKFNARKNIKRRSREANGNGLFSRDESNSSELSSCTQTSASDLSIDSQSSLKHYFRRLLREHEMLMDYMRTKCRPCRCKKCDKKQRAKKEYSVDSEGFDSSNRRRTRKHEAGGKTSAQKKRHFPSEKLHRSRKLEDVWTPERSRNKSANFRDVSTSDESSSRAAKNYCSCDCYRELRKIRRGRNTFCRKCIVQELYEHEDIDSIDEPWLRGPKMVPEKVRGRHSCGRQKSSYCN